MVQCTNIVSSFCKKYEMNYLIYHTPFLVNGIMEIKNQLILLKSALPIISNVTFMRT